MANKNDNNQDNKEKKNLDNMGIFTTNMKQLKEIGVGINNIKKLSELSEKIDQATENINKFANAYKVISTYTPKFDNYYHSVNDQIKRTKAYIENIKKNVENLDIDTLTQNGNSTGIELENLKKKANELKLPDHVTDLPKQPPALGAAKDAFGTLGAATGAARGAFDAATGAFDAATGAARGALGFGGGYKKKKTNRKKKTNLKKKTNRKRKSSKYSIRKN